MNYFCPKCGSFPLERTDFVEEIAGQVVFQCLQCQNYFVKETGDLPSQISKDFLIRLSSKEGGKNADL